MDNRTYKTPLRYRIGHYEIDLVTFEICKVSYTFKNLDQQSKKRLLKKWLNR